ncbi:hypothetical protein [Pseudomonas aeruginosa]|uniref:hypothetical protein n=1 Tax=Pseudomonas aeruginosa TaxID=287 RepID=UPI0029036AFD|nr:hypothetical protein [Pseudomonas aeruginosa]MDU0536537.1 hypothetical protein [Pseudomonas aeruginosa]MEA8680888.1 hypothetical protein [Pseudomonas aeruginosa]
MLALIGLCQGYYSETRTINGQNGQTQITEHSVLLQVEQPNKGSCRDKGKIHSFGM